MKRKLAAIALLLTVLTPMTVPAQTLPGPVQDATDTALLQCSTGIIEVWGFIDVGQASVWLPECSRLDWPLEPPVLLRFGYDREVPGDAFAESALAMLERNLDEDSFRAKKTRLRAFNANYRDTAEGDVYSMLYDKEGRLTLWLNDQRLASEQGHDFARDYLKIWFGPRPYSRKLKKSLLTADR